MTRSRAFERLTETEYDAVIIGTGLCESILAAALASAGSKVLHLDTNAFYGGAWATLPLSQIDELIVASVNAPQEEDPAAYMHASPGTTLSQQIETQFGRDHQLFLVPDLPLHKQLFSEGAHPVSLESDESVRIPPDSRRNFWLDLVPRPIMAAGAMVDLLVRTNVGHYIDFRALDSLYVEFGDLDGLQQVPGSRADVFQNRFISMLEKRLLMRFVKKCYEGNDHLENDDVQGEEPSPDVIDTDEGSHSFMEDMSVMGLTEKLQQFVVHSIAFATGSEDSISSADGVNAVRTYQQSMMKFGTKTPFLYANYGSGELSQAFCRLCAVKGGTYVLRRGAAALVKSRSTALNGGEAIPQDRSEERTTVGVITTEQELVKCQNVFVSNMLVEGMDLGETAAGSQTDELKIWRLMAIIDGSIVRDASCKRIMITVPRGVSGNDTSAVRIRQLDDTVMICPCGFFVLYAESLERGGCERDVLAACRRYIDMEPSGIDASTWDTEHAESTPRHLPDAIPNEDEPQSCAAERKPRMLWGSTYMRRHGTQRATGEGIVLVSAADYCHDADEAIAEAKRCFAVVHPEEEFFPVSPPETEANEVDQSAEPPTAGAGQSEVQDGDRLGSQIPNESG